MSIAVQCSISKRRWQSKAKPIIIGMKRRRQDTKWKGKKRDEGGFITSSSTPLAAFRVPSVATVDDDDHVGLVWSWAYPKMIEFIAKTT